jgi:hypothetical protein
MDLVVSSFDLVYKFNDFTYCSHSTNFLLELCVADSYFFRDHARPWTRFSLSREESTQNKQQVW